jgi:hypothetical protein
MSLTQLFKEWRSFALALLFLGVAAALS